MLFRNRLSNKVASPGFSAMTVDATLFDKRFRKSMEKRGLYF